MAASALIQELITGLGSVGYLADKPIASAVYFSQMLAKPLLIEGPAGTGKTELAKSVAALLQAPLIRLQCHEGLNESKVLYEWNYRKQLLWLQAAKGDEAREWASIEADIFGPAFLLERPLLRAISSPTQAVLLIDEVDRMEIELEALLLEVLSDYAISIPELGTVKAKTIPIVFLTSNVSRDLSEALKRRCLFLHLGYPGLDREREIVKSRIAGVDAGLVERATLLVSSLRGLDLEKPPSIAETIDWIRALKILDTDQIDTAAVSDTINILLKNSRDIETVMKRLHEFSSDPKA